MSDPAFNSALLQLRAYAVKASAVWGVGLDRVAVTVDSRGTGHIAGPGNRRVGIVRGELQRLHDPRAIGGALVDLARVDGVPTVLEAVERALVGCALLCSEGDGAGLIGAAVAVAEVAGRLGGGEAG
jgi:hypothetical protein